MIKMKYQMPSEESVETMTRVQSITTTIIEEDCTIEMLAETAKMLHDQNYDLDISIKVKVPK